MDGITYIYNVNGKPVGIYDYTNGQSVPIEENEPNPAAGSPIASKPDPGKEISFWSRFLNIASYGGKTGGAAACVSSPNGSNNISQACKDNVEPNFKLYKDMDPTSTDPSPFYEKDYSSEAGVTVTWEPESPVPNCDGNFDHQRIVVHFRDGDQTFYPDPVTGKIKIEKNFKYEPATSIAGDFIYYNPNTGDEIVKPNVVTLYKPTPAQETSSQCYAPRIDGDIQTEPAVVYVGQPIKITKSRDTIVPQCGEGALEVGFVIGDQRRGAQIDEQNNYYVTTTFQESGETKITLIARQGSSEASKEFTVYVNSDKPKVGALSINPASINVRGQITYGSLVTFDLSNTTDYDGEPSDLEVILLAGSSSNPMAKNGALYSATIPAAYWGPPITAQVRDRNRDTSADSSLWSLPPIVSPDLSSCQANPRPRAFVVVGPDPGENYDVNSNLPVKYQIYGNNCDKTTDSLLALCDFGPLGIISGTGNISGIITIETPLTEKLTGFFPCDIIGKNGSVLEDGATLWPPYYATPIVQQTSCAQSQNQPLVGGLTVNRSSLNALGHLTYGSQATFDQPATDCDGDPSNLRVTLHAGTSTASMPKNGNVYSASLTVDYWGAPIYAIVEDLDRGTQSISYLWSVPPIDAPASPGNPLPKAFTVAGPVPFLDYDITSNLPVNWQIWTANYDNTTDGLSATCRFGALTPASGTGNASGVIPIQKILTQRLTGSFPCDIKGKNGQTLVNGAVLYPPYYKQ